MFYRTESGITNKASRETEALTFFPEGPEGRTYSPPQAMVSALAVCVHVCGRRALYEVLFRHFAPKRQICFGGSTPPFSPCGEKQQILHSYNRYTRKEVIAYRHIPS